MTNPKSAYQFKYQLLSFFLLSLLAGCKKDNSDIPNYTQNISTVSYNWGEFAINKKVETDYIKYNTNSKIDSVITYGINNFKIQSIGFSYVGDTIKLNTSVNDKYHLDGDGRVIYHSTEEVQNGNNIISIERFTYDAAGYLNKVTISSDFNNTGEQIFSVINYEVQNGNYIKYSLSDIKNGTVTRSFSFSYNIARKVNSPVSFFSPIFANNTNSNIDKYLNYGKASVNLPIAINYYLTNLDGTVSKGLLNISTSVNNHNYITSLQIVGNNINSFPSDNISPLPRSMNFLFSN